MTPTKVRAEDPGREMAQWLLEAGRRRPSRRPDTEVEAAGGYRSPARPATAPTNRTLARQTTMLAGLVAAYLQYFYLGVMVQIASLPTVVLYTAVPS